MGLVHQNCIETQHDYENRLPEKYQISKVDVELVTKTFLMTRSHKNNIPYFNIL